MNTGAINTVAWSSLEGEGDGASSCSLVAGGYSCEVTSWQLPQSLLKWGRACLMLTVD